MTDFDTFGFAVPLRQAIEATGYKTPTPIQEQAIPKILEGRDVLGLAQTGTGKTASFGLPILQFIVQKPTAYKAWGFRALILAPTRELASQIADNIGDFSRFIKGFRIATVFGGVGQGRQVDNLRKGVDVLVATTGRLLDLANQGYVDFSATEFLVLDEADRMLDMGFIHDIRNIAAKLPNKCQTMLFSATFPDNIRSLSNTLLSDPVQVQVVPQQTSIERIEQKILFLEEKDKKEALLYLLKKENKKPRCVVVFTLMKHEANKIAAFLQENGIEAAALHGNKSQSAREKAMSGFRSGNVEVLVATDIAARGIDVEDVSLVVNYDLPNIPESYVHRIGRGGRAGRHGSAYSFCTPEQRAWLKNIEKTVKLEIPVDLEQPFHSEAAQWSTMSAPVLGKKRGGSGGRRGSNTGNRKSFSSKKPTRAKQSRSRT
ncbi:DEAD/DEAH box helicase [Acetobacteraceae bacterium]|nr:DEAD/DEAH box helicase [Acetobacteraceae bacterium]